MGLLKLSGLIDELNATIGRYEEGQKMKSAWSSKVKKISMHLKDLRSGLSSAASEESENVALAMVVGIVQAAGNILSAMYGTQANAVTKHLKRAVDVLTSEFLSEGEEDEIGKRYAAQMRRVGGEIADQVGEGDLDPLRPGDEKYVSEMYQFRPAGTLAGAKLWDVVGTKYTLQYFPRSKAWYILVSGKNKISSVGPIEGARGNTPKKAMDALAAAIDDLKKK